MSNEIHIIGPSGQTCYAAVISDAGLWSNAGVLEAFTPADYAGYIITVTEAGSTGIFDGNFPSALAAGSYDVVLFLRAGGSPANGDRAVGTQSIQWQGVASSSGLIPIGTLTGPQMRDYIVHGGLVRDDFDTEVYEALTDTIMELDQIFDSFDEREVETASTDTIAVLGDYKINTEVDHGNLLGVRLLDGTKFGRRLTQVSKTTFDLLIPNPSNTAYRNYPEYFCRFAGQIQIGPIPDKTTYVYELAYSKRLAAPITAATSEVPYSAQYREVLKDGTLWRVFDNLKIYDVADRFGLKFTAGKARITKHESKEQDGARCMPYQDI